MAWRLWDKNFKKFIVKLTVNFMKITSTRTRNEVIFFVHKSLTERGIKKSKEDIKNFLEYVQEKYKPKNNGKQLNAENSSICPGENPTSSPAEVKGNKRASTFPRNTSVAVKRRKPSVTEVSCSQDNGKQLNAENSSICPGENPTSSPAEVKGNKRASTFPRNTSVAVKRRKPSVTEVSCSQDNGKQLNAENSSIYPGENPTSSPAEVKGNKRASTFPRNTSVAVKRRKPSVTEVSCSQDNGKQLNAENSSICPGENPTSSPAEVKGNKRASTFPRNTSVAVKRRKPSVTEVSCSQGSSSSEGPCVREMEGNYLKLETGPDRQPVFKELQQWPSINLNTARGMTPFGPVTKKTTSEVKDESEWPAAGKCVICNVNYTNIKAHLLTPQHLKFANNPKNYAKLDDLIKLKSIDAFLASQM